MLPHWQAPAVEQASARAGSQPTHAAPPLPHAVSECGLQVVPEQHPVGQLAAVQPLQTPTLHCWPAGQTWQAAPAEAQAAVWDPGRQVSCSQQPAHDSASQTHAPLEQRWPAPHAGPAPHTHEPWAEQPLAFFESHAAQLIPLMPHAPSDLGMQLEPAQQPLGQELGSQTQAPPTHRWPAMPC